MNPSNRQVVIHNPTHESGVRVATEMLSTQGCQIAWANSVSEAIEKAALQPTELLVLSIPDTAEQRQALSRLSTLPAPQRPREVAILSDEINDDTIQLRRSVAGSKVHLFVRPIHVHGLLSLIKRLERNQLAHN